ncbi:General transcription factor 2-related zinc finger protein [Abeliophyllum distichum]|uniref:General transcription factor 2-related zinc finger protein n=1 Tax=Abeliophyllum distichum TaxID=126358 RepID=A0ABD1V834_9LAMI
MNDIEILNESDEIEEIDAGNDCDEMNNIVVGEDRGEINVEQLPSDHGLRKPINKNNVNVRDIQKDIVNAIAFETTRVIISEIGDGLFSILIDKSCDISTKEQMSIALQYVKNGYVMERFIGIQHVSSTTPFSLKVAIDDLFSRYSLSLSNLRGQGYNGASNMQGEYNGLKTLILKDNVNVYYIYYFSHQLQLALLAMAKKHADIQSFYYLADSVDRLSGVILFVRNKDSKFLKHSMLVKYQVDEAFIKTLLSSIPVIHIGPLTMVVYIN